MATNSIKNEIYNRMVDHIRYAGIDFIEQNHKKLIEAVNTMYNDYIEDNSIYELRFSLNDWYKEYMDDIEFPEPTN